MKNCTHALFFWVYFSLLLFFWFYFAFAHFLLLFCTLKRWNEPFKFSQLDQSGPKFTQSGKWRRRSTHRPQFGLYGTRQAFGCTSTNSFKKRFICLHWRQWRWFRCFSFTFFCFWHVWLFVYLFCLQTFFPSRKSNE